MSPKNLRLNHLVPTVATDGNAVFINEQNVPTLVFFEARHQTDTELHADVTAAVRMASIDDLEALQKAIADTIKQHKTREQ